MKHIFCYSGGHTSAIAAIEGVRRFGAENCILVNHDIHFSVEGADIKRFKNEVSDYLGVPITYVNHKNAEFDQFDVCVQAKAFKVGDGSELCTNRLKTAPFMKWLPEQGECIVYYGFDPHEKTRIQRRSSIMAAQGYRTDFPVALWGHRTIFATEDIGIRRPNTYAVFKHGNCVGCLEAGWQHWYIVFCTRPDIWLKAKWAEDQIGYAIHHDDNGPVFLEDMEEKFATMQAAGVPATEQVTHQRWWADARKVVKIHQEQERAVACDECSL